MLSLYSVIVSHHSRIAREPLDWASRDPHCVYRFYVAETYLPNDDDAAHVTPFFITEVLGPLLLAPASHLVAHYPLLSQA